MSATLGYLRRGWQPLPLHTPTDHGCSCRRPTCDSVGKHPRINWPAGRAVTETDIRNWERRWPDMNVGIVTGAVSGLLVLDVDTKYGGDKSLNELDRRYRLPATLTVITGSGGLHLYFKHPGFTVPPSAGKLMPGLDIRADRAMVVAPPSLHATGNRYRWADLADTPAECPGWLAEALKPPKPKPVKVVTISDRGLDAYTAAALNNAAARIAAAPPGGHAEVINREGWGIGRLVGAGIVDEQTALDHLEAACQGLCEKNHASQLMCGFRKGQANPAQVAS